MLYIICGVWCVVCGVWCVVCGVWCVVCNLVRRALDVSTGRRSLLVIGV
jgi:hypothetical protein